MRVRFEERLGRQLVEGNPRNSPRASYTFPASDTTKLRAGESDARLSRGKARMDGSGSSSGEGCVEIVKPYATFFDSLNRPCGIYYSSPRR
jgi:hypothetical protein